MTLLVAVKIPTKNLNPSKRPLRFIEPGIIIAADTRFSYRPGTKVVDDAQKLWPLCDTAFAGYAGDVEISERALLSAHCAVRENRRWDDPGYVTSALRAYLRYWRRVFSARRKIWPIIIFLGLRTPNGRFKLFELRDDKNFDLLPRSGMRAEGTGAERFKPVFDQEVDHITHGWAAPARSGYKFVQGDAGVEMLPRTPSDLIEIPMISVANLILAAVDVVVDKAGLKDVGGWTQLITLSERGMIAPKARRSRTGAEWVDITRHELRSRTEMTGAEFEVPLLDGNCRFPKGARIKIQVHPGSITGRRSKN